MTDQKKVSYTVVKDEKDADAAAWVFLSKKSFKKEFIQLPTLKSDEIRGRVLYSSICYSDCMIGKGKWSNLEYPICPGHEVIAEVTMKGVAVNDIGIGDIVGIGPFERSCGKCKFCQKDWNHVCENMPIEDRISFFHRFGGFATHVNHPAKFCIKIPKDIALNKASPFLCSGVSVFTPISLYVKPDDKVAILGCGGMGHLAVQFCKKMANEVTVITHNQEKIADIKKLGADKVLLFDDFNKNAFDLEYDVIIHTLPMWPKRDVVKKWIDSLNYYGRLIVLGFAPKDTQMDIDCSWLTLKSNLVISSLCGGKKQFEDMFNFMAKNKIEAWCKYYDFEEFDKAVNELEKGDPHFKIVVNTENAALNLEKLANK